MLNDEMDSKSNLERQKKKVYIIPGAINGKNR